MKGFSMTDFTKNFSYRSFGNWSGLLVLRAMIDSTLCPALIATPPVSEARW